MDMGSVRQWAEDGTSLGKLRIKVRDGEMVRLRHGIYATASVIAAAQGNKALRHALHVRAVLSTQSASHAAASHESAALVLGLPLLHDPLEGAVSITRPRQAGVSRSLIRSYTADLPDRHVLVKHGARVTTAARTVIDLGRTLPFMDAVVVADAALRKGMTTKSTLDEVIKACKGWPGAGKARRVLDFCDGRADSPLESCARVVFDAYRLPPPELQAEIIAGITFDPDGTAHVHEYHEYKVDFLWRRYKTVAETDGRGKYYAEGKTAIGELERDRLIREQGYRVIHITWKELFERPKRIIDRILTAFKAPTAY